MVKQHSTGLLVLLSLVFFMNSCGVKKPPTPLYSIPDTALKNSPPPSPSPNTN